MLMRRLWFDRVVIKRSDGKYPPELRIKDTSDGATDLKSRNVASLPTRCMTSIPYARHSVKPRTEHLKHPDRQAIHHWRRTRQILQLAILPRRIDRFRNTNRREWQQTRTAHWGRLLASLVPAKHLAPSAALAGAAWTDTGSSTAFRR